jgi:hypothetical protein
VAGGCDNGLHEMVDVILTSEHLLPDRRTL